MTPYGVNRRELDRRLRQLGGELEILNRTGDVVYRHPALPYRARANCRRKDATRLLVSFVRELEKILSKEA